MNKSIWIPVASLAAMLGVPHAQGAELIYGFDDASINGFVGANATVTPSTIGVTEGAGSMEISTNKAQTFGGAATSLPVPADLYNATSFNIDVTIVTPVTATYFDLVPNFFETANNGKAYEIDADLSDTSTYINLGGVAAGTYTYTLNLASYYDNDPNNPNALINNDVDATPGVLLAEDQAADLAAGSTMTDAITGFQLSLEHGAASAGVVYVDNITVPSISVPEPASIGLLGVAGAFFMKRRKH